MADLPTAAFRMQRAGSGGRLLLILPAGNDSELWSIRPDGSDLRKEVDLE